MPFGPECRYPCFNFSGFAGPEDLLRKTRVAGPVVFLLTQMNDPVEGHTLGSSTEDGYSSDL